MYDSAEPRRLAGRPSSPPKSRSVLLGFVNERFVGEKNGMKA